MITSAHNRKFPLPRILITLGDYNGVGPEVVVKALRQLKWEGRFVPIVVGNAEVWDFYVSQLGLHAPAPICKNTLWAAGYHYPGQTEFLADKMDASSFAMMLIAGKFRVGFVTTHYPLREIASLLVPQLISEKVEVVWRELKQRFKICDPTIAIAALNPHAGEGGELGREEVEVIQPTVDRLRQKGINIQGPFPADSLFANIEQKNFDVYMALYHDQGMIPIKMYSFGKAVNYTAGLPIPRTSPDHGTAFDIAGKNEADESSMVEAINLAVQLAEEGYPRS
ncbi:4-hydroxythreonine-4-phosphate dehydrogenase PdxA [candidate division KSB1 bacterium 4484_219]|nr:MAG: 4-hydroxythreonine-4-phosphate dehydrogenase PdxA [candidate division KSB1 bacterium 4484_219]